MTGFNSKREAAADKQEPEREALKLALGYVERNCPALVFGEIKKALAQPTHCQCTACKDGVLHASDCAVHNGPAYPAGECDCGVAQEPVAQGSKEHLKIMMEHSAWDDRLELSDALANIDEFYATAPPQSAQEHKAVISAWSLREVYFDEDGEPSMHRSPPKREWVGLTDEERQDIALEVPMDAVFITEAKLKEKNT